MGASSTCGCENELTLQTKNTRHVSDSCEDSLQGVNLNHNYDYSWAAANDLDEDQQECSNSYRGEAPFSESETQAVRDFILDHQETLKFVVNYQAYGNMLIIPFSGELNEELSEDV